jgi:ABC-type glycerol-3-phosphate transport system substrate-binding protein
MDTYAEWARSLYSENERFGLAMVWGEANLVTLTRAFGGDLIDAEGKQCMLLGNAGSEDALRWAYALAVEDPILPAPGAIENVPGAQVEGRVTMNWAGSLNVRNFKRDIQDESIARAHQGLLPTDANGKFPSQIRGGTWNMLKDTQHPQEVYEFLKHITNTDGCFSFNLVAGQGALVRPDVVDLLVVEDPVHEWFIPNLENGIPAHAPANSRGREYTDAVAQWATILMDPNQPVPFEQGLEDLHNNIQTILDLPAAS